MSASAYRTTDCELCLREFPRDAIGPVKHKGRTFFVCSECEVDFF